METGITRFVILALPRTGSSLLNGTLRQHPDVISQGELFGENIKFHFHDDFLPRIDLDRRAEDPAHLIDAVWAFAPGGERWRGFKHFHRQSPAATEILLADAGVKKIILERENRLAMHSSGQLARESGVWNRKASASEEKLDEIRAARAKFNPTHFATFCEKIDEIYRHYRDAAQGAQMTKTYEDLATGGIASSASPRWSCRR
ncbi:MAG: hypothetical protein AAFV96_09130 [Pseudomonadota bacterium]